MCERITSIMAGAAMGSDVMRSRLIGFLIQPVTFCCLSSRTEMHEVPFLSLIVQSLPLTVASNLAPEVQQLIMSTLSLLLNATHHCPATAHEFGRTELHHMAVVLCSALAETEKCTASRTTTAQRPADPEALASGVLCILINVVEQCSASAAALGEFQLGSQFQCRTSETESCMCTRVPKQSRGLVLCTCGDARLTFITSDKLSRSPKLSPSTKRRALGGRRRPLLVVNQTGSSQSRNSAPAAPSKPTRSPSRPHSVRTCPRSDDYCTAASFVAYQVSYNY